MEICHISAAISRILLAKFVQTQIITYLCDAFLGIDCYFGNHI